MRDVLRPTLTTAAWAVALVAAATLAAAWAFELVGGYRPCPLCLQQRLPYYAGIPAAVAAALLAHPAGRPLLSRLALAAVAVVFAYGAYLAAYHAGAEWGWWPGPADCAAAGGNAPRDAGALLGRMRDTQVVRCDEAAWRLFGLSFAGWNFVVSAGLVLVAALAAVRGYGSSSASQ